VSDFQLLGGVRLSDTVRDNNGLAIKFYTLEGNYDLLTL